MSTTPEPRYRAKRAIFINGTRAFNAGDRVPAGHVETHMLGGAVERVDQGDQVETVARPRGKTTAADDAR